MARIGRNGKHHQQGCLLGQGVLQHNTDTGDQIRKERTKAKSGLRRAVPVLLQLEEIVKRRDKACFETKDTVVKEGLEKRKQKERQRQRQKGEEGEEEEEEKEEEEVFATATRGKQPMTLLPREGFLTSRPWQA
ncbi:hypothetical protein CISG_03451 [Coccidioides immitis RMSCC 3703]|uniref:Uncharacterized protein n=1 Tax=Coccidioides immitis RMSCC 3703 TaxID=454286 RepID=A0A0J8QLC6_COCIT|nr:hypothetical protein CISG_03451 [Coccidioides immitis RMSCC 3703]